MVIGLPGVGRAPAVNVKPPVRVIVEVGSPSALASRMACRS
jgi:hypothetical protein